MSILGNNKGPLVSILIPVYNSEKYLGETLKCILSQSWMRKELIIVDDGSTDNSLNIAQAYSSKHVKIITQKNSGACVARNRALKAAQGDYIQYVDADDLLSKHKIEAQLAKFKEFGDDIVASSGWVKFRDHEDVCKLEIPKRFLDRDWDQAIDWLTNSWKGKGTGQTSIWLTPRNIIDRAGEWDESLLFNQDGEYFSRVLLRANSIKYCEGVGVYYRSGNESSITGKFSYEKAKSHLASYFKYQEHLLSVRDTVDARRALMNAFALFIYNHYGNYPDLVEKAKSAIKSLGFSKIEPVGGRQFIKLANVLGFENTLKLRNLIR